MNRSSMNTHALAARVLWLHARCVSRYASNSGHVTSFAATLTCVTSANARKVRDAASAHGISSSPHHTRIRRVIRLARRVMILAPSAYRAWALDVSRSCAKHGQPGCACARALPVPSEPTIRFARARSRGSRAKQQLAQIQRLMRSAQLQPGWSQTLLPPAITRSRGKRVAGPRRDGWRDGRPAARRRTNEAFDPLSVGPARAIADTAVRRW